VPHLGPPHALAVATGVLGGRAEPNKAPQRLLVRAYFSGASPHLRAAHRQSRRPGSPVVPPCKAVHTGSIPVVACVLCLLRPGPPCGTPSRSLTSRSGPRRHSERWAGATTRQGCDRPDRGVTGPICRTARSRTAARRSGVCEQGSYRRRGCSSLRIRSAPHTPASDELGDCVEATGVKRVTRPEGRAPSGALSGRAART
jgi:hypothetical protein